MASPSVIDTTSVSNRLPILASEIKLAHRAAREAAQTSLERAIEAGERLIEAKGLVKHGGWLPWLKEVCDLSERSAQVYMRLARHKDVAKTKSAAAADLTIRAAVKELTEPKWPNKLSELARAMVPIPMSGCVKIALRENAAGWDEIWIVPSRQHDSYFYITHIWTPKDSGTITMTGTSKPARADSVADIVDIHMSCDLKGMAWRDEPFPPWDFNIMLFGDASEYIAKEADLQDCVDIAKGKIPSPNDAPVATGHGQGVLPQGPFCEMVFEN